jgi:hypothetical protein
MAHFLGGNPHRAGGGRMAESGAAVRTRVAIRDKPSGFIPDGWVKKRCVTGETRE